MNSLHAQSALITGATKGIGLACANKLINQGVAVTALGRDFDGFRLQASILSCDLSDLERLPSELSEFPSSIGVLLLNAGYGQFGGLEQFSFQQIERLINTNLVSNLFIIKHYLPLMKQQGGGDIVLIGSESSLEGAKAGAVYCASKFALRGLAQSIRADCRNDNIRVHLINPGPVNSDFFSPLNFEPQNGQEFVLNPEDVADAVWHALKQPRHVVTEELVVQAMKRSFKKK